MKNLQQRSAIMLLFILAPLVFSFALALDIYVPVVPDMVNVFHTNPEMVQLTLSLYTLVNGLGQLLVGPLSDQYGRRKLLIVSLLIFIIASLLCASAHTITTLILARILQGIGACACMVIAFAIVRDLFHDENSARIYSYLNGAISLSPLLAPLLGSYLNKWFGWQAIFIFLAIFASLALILVYKNVNETLTSNNRYKMQLNIVKNYLPVVRNGNFILYTLCAACSLSCFFVFFSTSSYIFIKDLGLSEQQFALLFGSIAIMYLIGSLISASLCVRIGIFNTVTLGASLILLSSIYMLTYYYVEGLSIMGFTLPILIVATGGSLCLGAGIGGALLPFPDRAATASALFGAFEFLSASIVGTIVMLWPIKNSIPIGVALLILGLISTLYCLWARLQKYHLIENKIVD